MTDILIVEDNEEIGTLLCDILSVRGYSVYLAANGKSALDFAKHKEAKLMLLDLMLPDMDGLEICRLVREKNNMPIIILSAKTAKEDKLNGLLLGADDYIEKPYDMDILLAKIGGIFQRRYGTDVLIEGALKIDKNRRTVYLGDEEIQMTVKEFDLLLLLAENKGRVLEKDKIFNRIWGFDSFSEPQTLTVHIKRLRKKLEKDPNLPARIQTVWGVGYKFE